VIQWLRRVEPDRLFLRAGERVWTYGEAADEVEIRITNQPQLIQPSLTPESVFAFVAGIAGGGATVVGPQTETTEPGGADLVVFTSGSTGPARGVRLTRANMAAAASASIEHLGHGPDDNWLLVMPLHHVGGLSIVVRQAFAGGSMTLLPGFDAATVAAAMSEEVTMVSVVPTMLRRLIPFGPFSDLRAVLVGGGPIPPGLLEEAAGVGLPVLPTYGMTETFGQVATLRPGSPLEYKVDPLPGIRIRTEPDGRIALKGAQVSPGYLGSADRPDPWLITNDLGELDSDGSLRVLGRADTIIVTGGENVSPERVESVLRGHPGVDETVVAGVDDELWGQIVIAVYSGSARAEDLEAWVSSRLPGHMAPKRLIRVAAIPKTAIGKPDRSAAALLGELDLGADD